MESPPCPLKGGNIVIKIKYHGRAELLRSFTLATNCANDLILGRRVNRKKRIMKAADNWNDPKKNRRALAPLFLTTKNIHNRITDRHPSILHIIIIALIIKLRTIPKLFDHIEPSAKRIPGTGIF